MNTAYKLLWDDLRGMPVIVVEKNRRAIAKQAKG